MVNMIAGVLLLCIVLCTQAAEFGTYYKLFNAQSLWNSRPVNPVFAPNVTIPDSDYKPSIDAGAFSTGIFLATSKDPAMTVYGRGYNKLNNVDALDMMNSITLPHWPADVVPAVGSDGHCDIVDETTGILHSFWVLKFDNASKCWNATQYAWTPLNGYGWGTPDHWYQGARAAGVPTSGGLIRKHDAADVNAPMFNYALAMSLTYNALGYNPTYVYPATSADSGAESANSGKIPEGALLMLPPDFNTSRITVHPNLKKIAETLKTYGAYVVDRNDGTPFAMYLESGGKLWNWTSWNNLYASQLELIQHSLRMVTSADYYLDGNGNKLVQPYLNQNLLSMRGPGGSWQRVSGDASCSFDTWSQSLVYAKANNQSSTHQNWSGRGINMVNWAKMKKNTQYTYKVEATGGITLKMVFQVNQTASGKVFDATLGDGQNATFVYPSSGPYMVLYAYKPAGSAGRVRGYLYETANMAPVTTTTTGTPSSTTNSPGSTTNSPSSTTNSPSSTTNSPGSTGTPSTATPTTNQGSAAAFAVPSFFFGVLALFMLCL